MNGRILIFGGTTEGRKLAEALTGAGIPHVVSVATEYGKEIELKKGEDSLLVGRKTSDEMALILTGGEYTLVVDATHPFAVRVSEEIMKACGATDTEKRSEQQFLGFRRNGAAQEASPGSVRLRKRPESLIRLAGTFLSSRGAGI